MKKFLSIAILALLTSCSKTPEKIHNEYFEELKTEKSTNSNWETSNYEDEMKMDNYCIIKVCSDTIRKTYKDIWSSKNQYASILKVGVRKMEKDKDVDIMLFNYTSRPSIWKKGPSHPYFIFKFDDQDAIVTSRVYNHSEKDPIYFVEDSLKTVILENLLKAKECKIKFDGDIYTFKL